MECQELSKQAIAHQSPSSVSVPVLLSIPVLLSVPVLLSPLPGLAGMFLPARLGWQHRGAQDGHLSIMGPRMVTPASWGPG